MIRQGVSSSSTYHFLHGWRFVPGLDLDPNACALWSKWSLVTLGIMGKGQGKTLALQQPAPGGLHRNAGSGTRNRADRGPAVRGDSLHLHRSGSVPRTRSRTDRAVAGGAGLPRSLAVVLVVLAFLEPSSPEPCCSSPLPSSARSSSSSAISRRWLADLAATGWVADLEQRFTGAVDLDKIFANLGEWASDPKNVVSLGGGVVSIGAGVCPFPRRRRHRRHPHHLLRRDDADDQVGHALPRRGELATDRRIRSEEVTRSIGRYVLGGVAWASSTACARRSSSPSSVPRCRRCWRWSARSSPHSSHSSARSPVR